MAWPRPARTAPRASASASAGRAARSGRRREPSWRDSLADADADAVAPPSLGAGPEAPGRAAGAARSAARRTRAAASRRDEPPPDGPRFGFGGSWARALDVARRAALLSSCGMSIPVRPFTVADASVTVRVAFFTTSDAPSVESTVRLSIVAIGSAAARTISGSIDEDGRDDRGLVELAVRVGAQREGLRLGLALGERDARLGVALEGRLLRDRLGVDLGDARLRLALGDLDRGLGLAGELDPLGIGLRRRDPGLLVALGAPDLGLRLGLGGADRARDELLLRAVGLELGELGLAADDLLLRLGLGERPGLGGLRLGGRGQRLDLGRAERHVALGVELDLLRLGLADRGLLVGRALAMRASRSRRAVSCWPMRSM